MFESIPSLLEDRRTVLDETRESNKQLEIDSNHRLWEKGFVPHDQSTLGLSKRVQEQLMKMMLTPEEQLEDVTIEQWFSPDYFKSQIWYYWASMLAFQPYHSLIEMKRYTVRFMQHLDGAERLKGILRTKYDQYNSLILPLQKYLTDHGVGVVSNTTVTDFDLHINSKDITVTGLQLLCNGETCVKSISEKDIVYFTNGSMTQNSSQGSMTEAPIMNRDTKKTWLFYSLGKISIKSRLFWKTR